MKTVPTELAERLYAQADQFLQDGAHIRIDDVATATETPRATLYYYFSGKDDLLNFLIREKLDRAVNGIEVAVRGEGDVVERLVAALEAVLHTVDENPALCKALLTALAQSGTLGEVTLAADRAVFAPLRALLAEGQASGQLNVTDPATTASALFGALSMVGVGQLMQSGQVNVDAIAHDVVPQMLHGIVRSQ
ncbi:MAG: hypothetical protein CL878_07835 [Dehalococcoidia bacterium]|nr:hypothetical protein [Dehalococcoidia bacterium]